MIVDYASELPILYNETINVTGKAHCYFAIAISSILKVCSKYQTSLNKV